MWLLIHGLIFIGLTMTTKWGGVVWLLAVVASRMVRRGLRLLFLVVIVIVLSWFLIWSADTTEASGWAELSGSVR